MIRLKSAVLAVVASLMCAAAAHADPTAGELFYSADQNVKKVHYSWDGSAFTLGTPTTIQHFPLADSLVFTPDGKLLVGGGDHVYKLDVSNGTFETAGVPQATLAIHLALSPDGQTLYGGSGGNSYNGVDDSNTLLTFPVSPLGDGTAHAVTGAEHDSVASIAFTPAGQAFYVTGVYFGSGFAQGDFGAFDAAAFTTSAPTITDTRGMHGLQYDPYTGDLMSFGGDDINQIDPATGQIVSSFNHPTGGFGGDQGTVDGHGHAFFGSGSDVLIVDYSASHMIGQGVSKAAGTPDQLDDLAPIVGAPPPPEPQPNPNPNPTPSPTPGPLPHGPQHVTIGNTNVTLVVPHACLPIGATVKARVTSRDKHRISRDRFGFVQRVKIIAAAFRLDNVLPRFDTKAAFKGVWKGQNLAAGTHAVSVKLAMRKLRSRGRQHQVGKVFNKKLVGRFKVCG